MSSLGIYFGPKLISIVEAKSAKIINNSKIPQPAISAGELEEKVPAEVKGIEIVALFKEELRRNKIEAKEATICFSGKDLIIRTLEMPLLPREELRSAVNFEAKKYIPFRVEELVSDFQVKFDRPSRTNTVLFIGIKKEVLERYISIFSQLNIKISSIEYSAFSTLRLLRLSGAGNRGVVGILETDLKAEDETNFTVIEDGFPLFSRDIALTSSPEGLQGPQESGSPATLEKLKTEMRVSLDYYHRKFPTKNIKKVFLLSDQDYRLNLEALIQEVGLSAKFIDTAKYIDRSIPYSLTSIKGFSASLAKTIKTGLKLNLLAAKKQSALLQDKSVQAEALSLLRGLKLDYRMVALGLFICLATVVLGYYSIGNQRKEFNSIMGLRSAVATVSPEAPYQELTDADAKYKARLDILDNLIKKQLYVTELLDAIPGIIPKGAWLTKFSFDGGREGGASLSLEGAVYLGDSDKEFQAVNQFLSALKGAANFSKYFKEINIVSMDRRQLTNKGTLTNFLILCKPSPKEKTIWK